MTGIITQVSDVVVPEVFNAYVQLLTEEKSKLIASGALVKSPQLDQNLQGGGLTFAAPSFADLTDDLDNISSDSASDSYTAGSADSSPQKTKAVQETSVRLSRNQSWSSSDLAGSLAGADPMDSIANRVADYWSRRLQAAFISTVNGVFADNDAAPAGTEHVQGDLTNNIAGTAYSAGVTDFNSSAFIDAAVTMGDSMGNLSMVCVHSIVYSRMQKNNLITFIPDSVGVVSIPTFLGRTVIIDDGLPTPEAGVYHTWLFGAGASLLGVGQPKVPTEMARKPDAGNGGGQEVLYNRVEWAIHPVGHRYAGTPANGGPSNAATSNNLANADSWMRVYGERKQIPMARLITREF